MSGKILQIVTNNPEIYWSPDTPYGIVFVEGSPIDVLDRAEELIQCGWRLISAPLPPNGPIMRAPYRSLLIEESESRYDRDGILSLAKARERYLMERQRKCSEPGEDFALIDRQMLLRALRDFAILNGVSS